MPSLAECACGHHPGHTTACHQNRARIIRGSDDALSFTPDGRITKTCYMRHIKICKSVKTTFIAAAAAVDLIYAAVTDLVHKFRISKLGTAHGDHVNQVVFQNFLGKIGIVYAADPDCDHACFTAHT